MAQKTDVHPDIRKHLVRTARVLFKTEGYDAVAVPQISREAGVSRDVLYGCFSGKLDLFEAVVRAEFFIIQYKVWQKAKLFKSPLESVIAGGDAFIHLFADKGTRRMMFDDGPRILGVRYVIAVDQESTSAVLRVGIQAAKEAGELPARLDVDATASLMSGAYDRAVLDGANGNAERTRKACESIRMIWEGLAKLA